MPTPPLPGVFGAPMPGRGRRSQCAGRLDKRANQRGRWRGSEWGNLPNPCFTCRVRMDRRLTLKREGGIHFHEDQVRGEARRLTEAGPAVGSTGISRPRGALRVGENAPQGPDAAKDCAVEELGGAGAFTNNATSASGLAVPGPDADKRPASARLGYVLYLHKCCRGGGVPGPVRVHAQAVGVSRGTRASSWA